MLCCVLACYPRGMPEHFELFDFKVARFAFILNFSLLTNTHTIA